MKINLTNFMAVSLASFLLTGCVVKDKNKSPVVVEHPRSGTITEPSSGQSVIVKPADTYNPTTPIAGQKERGYASWYGKELHGERVASGETFDMYALTAAHRTIAFNTLVKVTNLKTGKNVIVRINDRGPYNQGRIIDLSYKAALELGITSSGSAEVQLEVMGKSDQGNRGISVPVTTTTRETYKPVVVEEADANDFVVTQDDTTLDSKTIDQINEIEKTFVKPTKKVKRKPKKIYRPKVRKKQGSIKIQIGSFTSRSGAKQVQARAKRANPKYNVVILKRKIGGTLYYKVAIKGFKNRTDAKRFINRGKYPGSYILH